MLFRRFLRAVETADVQAVLDCMTPDASWQNVPHPPSKGHADVAKLFGAILPSCEKVRWDVESISYGPEEDGRALVWAERIDRFWIGGAEYAVRCNGVFEFDLASGLIVQVRDYVDLGEWRSRLASADLGAGSAEQSAAVGQSAAGQPAGPAPSALRSSRPSKEELPACP